MAARLALLTLTLAAFPLSLAQTTDMTSLFVGSGTISVLNSTDYDTASPSDAIGCLSADGYATMDDCAVFTHIPGYPYSLTTDSGNCTFMDSAAGKNEDSTHANVGTYAFRCEERTRVVSDNVYTVDGFNYPFICVGDVSCFYDLKAPPNATEDVVDSWRFYWSSNAETVPAGHVQTLWLWNPVNGTNSTA